MNTVVTSIVMMIVIVNGLNISVAVVTYWFFVSFQRVLIVHLLASLGHLSCSSWPTDQMHWYGLNKTLKFPALHLRDSHSSSIET